MSDTDPQIAQPKIGRPRKYGGLMKPRMMRFPPELSDRIDEIVQADKSGLDFSSVVRILIVEALDARDAKRGDPDA